MDVAEIGRLSQVTPRVGRRSKRLDATGGSPPENMALYLAILVQSQHLSHVTSAFGRRHKFVHEVTGHTPS
jgi:hypothetical protein